VKEITQKLIMVYNNKYKKCEICLCCHHRTYFCFY